MEAMGSIEHLCPRRSGLPGRQSAHDSPYRGIAMDHIISACIYNFLQLPIRAHILETEGRPVKRHVKNPFHKIQLQTVLTAKLSRAAT